MKLLKYLLCWSTDMLGILFTRVSLFWISSFTPWKTELFLGERLEEAELFGDFDKHWHKIVAKAAEEFEKTEKTTEDFTRIMTSYTVGEF